MKRESEYFSDSKDTVDDQETPFILLCLTTNKKAVAELEPPIPALYSLGRLQNFKAFGVTDFEALPSPRIKLAYRECGVPLELQTNPGKGCCHDAVNDLLCSVLSEDQHGPIDPSLKESIAHTVSLQCMKPPGMTHDEIRVAIATEFAKSKIQ